MLVLSVRSSDEAISTFNKLSLTYSRIRTFQIGRSHYLLPYVYLQLSDEDLRNVDNYNGKIKVGVLKIEKLSGEFCGASLFLSKILQDCNFQSMKSPVEMNSLLSKFFCYITWLLYQLIRRDTGRLANEAFT